MIVRTQEEGSLISPWSLMACLLLQAPITTLTEEGLQWHGLTEKTLWLRKLVLDFRGRLNWPGEWARWISKISIYFNYTAASSLGLRTI